MAGKRRDKNGRVLKTGESQRKSDGIYQYRYTDIWGKIQYVYCASCEISIADFP